jgi:Zn-dependent protease
MREHLRLGRIAGIDIGVNASVTVIATLLAWSLASAVLPELEPGHGHAAYWATALTVTAAFFASLLAHELAHALVARHHGIGVDRITLWLLGGVSTLSSDVRRPQDEMPMAAAGPATSLGIGVLALAVANTAGLLGLPELWVAALGWLATVNLVLGVFNLAPAFPLDGGRVLRALLWQRWDDHLRATTTAARAGTGFAYLLFAAGGVFLLGGAALSGLWLGLLGLFVLNASKAELTNTVETDILTGVPVRAVMTPGPVTVPGDLTVTELIDLYVFGARHTAYPVIDDHGRTLGLVDLAQLRRVPAADRSVTPVRRCARPLADLATGTPDEPVTALLRRMTTSGATRALILTDDRAVGIVTLSDVARTIDARMLGQRSAPPQPTGSTP